MPRPGLNSQLLLVAVTALIGWSVVSPGAAMAATPADCAKFASTIGSDAAPGTEAAPFRTFQKLGRSLTPGQTGCLRGGVYAEHVSLTAGGSPEARVTFRSYPGERATHLGRLTISDSANFVTVEDLNLDGRTAPACGSGSTCTILPSPTVSGDDVVFRGNDVTNGHTAICFLLGPGDWGRAYRTILEGNRIHDCGRVPSTNKDHGIYVEQATDVRIAGNVIHDNTDRGIQLYHDAQRTAVVGNVIDGNGEGVFFGGEHGTATSNSKVTGNLITNSRIRYNVESWWAAGNPIGQNNVVTSNCIYGGARQNAAGGVSEEQIGFTAFGNLAVDPLYTNRTAKDFSLRAGSPCASTLDTGVVTAPLPPPPPAATEPVIVEPVVEEPVSPTPSRPKKRRVLRAVLLSVSAGSASRQVRRRVGLIGRVVGQRLARRPRVTFIQTRVGRRWRRIARVRISRAGRFRVLLNPAARGHQRTIRLRATVRRVGTSRVVRVRR